MRLVIVESPFAGDLPKNIAYARAAVRDSLARGEAPIASHLLYTQPGILDDDIPAERQWGIDAGLAWRRRRGLGRLHRFRRVARDGIRDRRREGGGPSRRNAHACARAACGNRGGVGRSLRRHAGRARRGCEGAAGERRHVSVRSAARRSTRAGSATDPGSLADPDRRRRPAAGRLLRPVLPPVEEATIRKDHFGPGPFFRLSRPPAFRGGGGGGGQERQQEAEDQEEGEDGHGRGVSSGRAAAISQTRRHSPRSNRSSALRTRVSMSIHAPGAAGIASSAAPTVSGPSPPA